MSTTTSLTKDQLALAEGTLDFAQEHLTPHRPQQKRSWPPSPGSSTTSASPSSSPNTAWSASSSTPTV
ncbi:hypothetical protein [Streptomyces sp. Wh19]|uniref:Uncharacterized protein n=1 Tax=Streptomyces sanglieri TaxID=193460 RepID=A0ABW2WQJ0_9ACTN|nr:hypothetical protein [Streptomyces sp. Wh19]MDV9197397.1 hypothetical protein [Streptomyces sp. Wh19]